MFKKNNVYSRIDKNEKRNSKIAKYNDDRKKPMSFKKLVSGAKFDQSVDFSQYDNLRFMMIAELGDN